MVVSYVFEKKNVSNIIFNHIIASKNKDFESIC